MLDELRAELDALARDPALYAETSFGARAEALDTLEFAVIDRLDRPAPRDPHQLAALRHSADELKHRLEAIDAGLFQRLRAEIRNGGLRGQTLRRAIATCTGLDPGDEPEAAGGYDTLDAFVNGLLGITTLPVTATPREPEMVPYQKTPARIVLRLLDLAGLSERDVFFDIGAGLGHAPILVHLLCGARALGVEVEPAYCAAAAACTAGLGLSAVTFIQTDARVADYAGGTVFFLYTPFTGTMLQAVLERLRDEADKREIQLVAFGPCVPMVAQQPWLIREHTHTDAAGELAVFRSL